jgi:hypothetical protein
VSTYENILVMVETKHIATHQGAGQKECYVDLD